MTPYKVKHLPTGLYYQPHKHRGSNISKRGKIYQTPAHGLSEAISRMKKYPKGNKGYNELFPIYVEKDSPVYKLLKDILVWEEYTWANNQLKAYTKVEDWVLEEIC